MDEIARQAAIIKALHKRLEEKPNETSPEITLPGESKILP
jgi:hypothetical protein